MRVKWFVLKLACWTFKRLPWSVQMRLWRSRWYALARERNRYQNFADFVGAGEYEH